VATSLIWLSIMMNLVVLYFSTNWLPTVLIGSGLHTGDAVRTTAYFQVGGTIGALVVGYLADRIMPTLVPGVAFACAALFISIVGRWVRTLAWCCRPCSARAFALWTVRQAPMLSWVGSIPHAFAQPA
jgi:cyanate permease